MSSDQNLLPQTADIRHQISANRKHQTLGKDCTGFFLLMPFLYLFIR